VVVHANLPARQVIAASGEQRCNEIK
jgi:hypothetical protein